MLRQVGREQFETLKHSLLSVKLFKTPCLDGCVILKYFEMTNCNNNTLQCENDQPRAETQVKPPSAHNINLNVCPPDMAVDSLVHGLILTTSAS